MFGYICHVDKRWRRGGVEGGGGLVHFPLNSLQCTREIVYRAASARTSDPGASIGRLRDHRMGIESTLSRPIPSYGANVASMLRAIASNVASRLRATSKYQGASSLLLPCCDYIVNMLRPCCVQHPPSGALLPSSST
jgi:hypothetical protein